MQVQNSKCFAAKNWLFLGLLLSASNLAAQEGRLSPNRPTGNQGTRVANSNPIRPAAPRRAPFPPLAAQDQQYLDSVLNYWETSSDKIKVYECKFTRWEYDPVFARVLDPKTGQLMAKTVASGVIKFASPDRGLYQVENQYQIAPPRARGESPTYTPAGELGLEKWICDGTSVFEFDYPRKRLVERPLPKEMQGKAIAEGPLPFLFGAKAAQIKNRYWIRSLPLPQGVKDEYWLEAYPKRQNDAARYKKVEVILSKDPFLPKAIHIYDVNYDPRSNPVRSSFKFEERQINPSNLLKRVDLLKLFHSEFYRPDTPSGWEKTVLNLNDPGPEQRLVSPTNRSPSRAQRTPSPTRPR
jgi:TIGR03009 family protein